MTICICYLLYIANTDKGRLPITENCRMSLSVKLLRNVVFYKTLVLLFSLIKQRTFHKIIQVLTFKIIKSSSSIQVISYPLMKTDCTLSVEINICWFSACPGVMLTQFETAAIVIQKSLVPVALLN